MRFKAKALSLLLLPCLTLVSCKNQPQDTVPPASTPGSSVVPPSSGGSSSNPYDSEYKYDYEANRLASSSELSAKKLKIFEGPSTIESSEKAVIKVDGNELFVYETRVNLKKTFDYSYPTTMAPVAMFDMAGSVHVEIEVPEEVTSVKVRPSAYEIPVQVKGRLISFDIEYPDDYVIEYNGDVSKTIHLFANEYDEEMYMTAEEASKDPNIVYIGPGVYKTDAIALSSGQTLFLAGGALVYGQIRTEDMNDITIKGRGIISGAVYDRRSGDEYTLPVEFRSGRNLRIEGVSFFDPAGWAITLYKCDGVVIRDVKIITARANGDGISVQSCSNVTVQSGFVRTFDDSLVVKNVARGSTSNIVFDGVKVWTDLAQSMEVGYETNGPSMKDITFKNITVYHNFHKAVISMHNADDAVIDGVTYQNITVEDGRMLGDNQTDGLNDFLIDFTIAYSPEWTVTAGKRGTVSNVLIKDVQVAYLEPSVIARINGESSESKIDGVRIENLNIAGRTVEKAEDIGLVTSYADNIKFAKSSSTIGAVYQLPYREKAGLPAADAELVPTVPQTGIEIPEFAGSDAVSYIGEKIDTPITAEAYWGAGSKNDAPIDTETSAFAAGSSGDALTDGNLATSAVTVEYPAVQADEFAAINLTFADPQKVGVIRLRLKDTNRLYYQLPISVYGRNVKSDGTVNANTLRVKGKETYEISRLNANLIDIKITPNNFKMLQLRIFADPIAPMNPVELADIEFYGSALSYNKSIIYSTDHSDVYTVDKLVDGDPNGTSYYESASLPATVVIDLGDSRTIKKIVLNLPASAMWIARTQRIEISGYDGPETSYDKMNFTTIAAATDYLFDPQTGNMVVLDVSSIQARYVKFVISSNTVGTYGAQLSEISIYGN